MECHRSDFIGSSSTAFPARQPTLPRALIRAIVTKITKIGGRGDIIRSSGWVLIALQSMGRAKSSDRLDGGPEI
jgi:hypothetical protein